MNQEPTAPDIQNQISIDVISIPTFISVGQSVEWNIMVHNVDTVEVSVFQLLETQELRETQWQRVAGPRVGSIQEREQPYGIIEGSFRSEERGNFEMRIDAWRWVNGQKEIVSKAKRFRVM